MRTFKYALYFLQIMARIIVKVPGFRCERCKHEWIPRVKTKEDPIICPKCKNPYWNIPKKKKK